MSEPLNLVSDSRLKVERSSRDRCRLFNQAPWHITYLSPQAGTSAKGEAWGEIGFHLGKLAAGLMDLAVTDNMPVGSSILLEKQLLRRRSTCLCMS